MDTVGAYRVRGKLGEGGMGVVYLAEHSLLGRKAAIKVLHPTFSANADIVARFFNEAKAVTSIADPGIVQIFDFGHAPDGSAYIVMELLEGEPMDKRIRRTQRISVDETLQLMRLVCHSLGAAHAKGIVHRDLKPENIYIVRDPAVPGGERPKILDFGIAKLSSAETSSVRTRTGAMMGTPTYMSPEQCRGAGDVDARSDIYSIGCVIMAMLTGRPPFLSDAMGDLIVAHMTTQPPLASSLAGGIPRAIDDILMRCLAKNPEARFATMSDLANAIDAVRTGTGPTIALDARPSNAALRVPPAISVVAHTTLGGAAAQTTPPEPKKSKLGAVVGAFVVVAAAVGITIGVVASKKDAPSSAASSAVTSDAAVVAAAPPDAPATAPAVGAPAVGGPVVASADPSSKDNPSTEKTSTDPSTVQPSKDNPSSVQPSSDKPSTDNPSSDKPSTDKSSNDKPGSDKLTKDKPGKEKPGSDKSAKDNSGKPGKDKPEHGDKTPPPGPVATPVPTTTKPTTPTTPEKTPDAPPPVAEPAPLPEFSAAMIKPVMDKLKPKLIACVDEDEDAIHLHTMKLHVMVAADGSITSVNATDADATETTVSSCVVKRVRGVKFPPSVKGGSFSYPITFR